MIVVLKTLCGCTQHMEQVGAGPLPLYLQRAMPMPRDPRYYRDEDPRFRGIRDVMVRRFELQRGDLDGQPWYLEMLADNSTTIRPRVDEYSYDRLQRVNEDLQRDFMKLANKYDKLHEEVYGMDVGL